MLTEYFLLDLVLTISCPVGIATILHWVTCEIKQARHLRKYNKPLLSEHEIVVERQQLEINSLLRENVKLGKMIDQERINRTQFEDEIIKTIQRLAREPE